MSEWKDATSYQRGDRERVPTVWSLELPSRLRILVMTSHVYSPGKWVMTCDPWFDAIVMEPQPRTLHEAQTRALNAVSAEAWELHRAIGNALKAARGHP